MVSDSTPPRRPMLTLDDLATPLSRRPERLHALSASDLAIAFSLGLDLAEGKSPGHGQRVAYIATMLADAMALEGPQRAGVFFGGLLHDAGVTQAGSDICRVAGVDEEILFGSSPLRSPDDVSGGRLFADAAAVSDAIHAHPQAGAEIVSALELPEEAVKAVASHHERWDGTGYPHGSSGDAIALEARILAAADAAEVLIGRESNALTARRRFPAGIDEFAGTMLDPAIVTELLKLSRDDAFWLGLYADDLPATLTALRGASDNRRSRRRVMRFAEVFADIADAKGGHTGGHARRTAESAEKLAEALELDGGHVEMVKIAALLHDIGLLGVPARIMSKPDILSISEMQIMRQHPSNSELILEPLNGFEEIAYWIARHHERPDGRGYPDMLSGEEIPLESRILSVADVHSALTSERPHRGAISPKDAKQILLGAAGTQLDAEMARLFVTLL